jgi:hypothetical protein
MKVKGSGGMWFLSLFSRRRLLGSSVTPSMGPMGPTGPTGPAGSAGSGGWVTVFDTDFSAQAAVSTLGDGTYNWLAANSTSYTWTKANSGAERTRPHA